MPKLNRHYSSGHEAIMRVLHTPPSRRRYVSLFPNMYAPLLNEIVYRLMPKGGNVKSFRAWHRAFNRARFTQRPTPKDDTNA